MDERLRFIARLLDGEKMRQPLRRCGSGTLAPAAQALACALTSRLV
jgi:hypothetical protein